MEWFNYGGLVFIVIIPLMLFSATKKHKKVRINRLLIANIIRRKEIINMKETVKAFLNMFCMVESITSREIGVIVEVNDESLVLQDSKGRKTAINLDYITTIHEMTERKK